MARLIVGLVLFVASFSACAQTLPFFGRDEAALVQSMPQLARDAIAVYRDDDREKYLGNLFRLQLATGHYVDAAATIRALRHARDARGAADPSLHLQYEIYAQAKALQAKRRAPFALAYAQAFHAVYGRLDDRSAHRALFLFGASVERMRDDLRVALEPHRKATTIALADALDLIRKQQFIEVYAATLPQVDALVAEDDARRYRIESDVLVETPAGVKIAALVVRPKAAAPLPALFEFTIYANDAWALAGAKKSAAYGYAGVVAYTRGKGRSPEAIVPFEHDGEDAAAVIDWISRQPWNDGRVGMYGGSYSGFTQWAAAKRRPKALKAMATSATVAPGIDVPMEGNVFLNFMYPWPFYTTNNTSLDDVTYDDSERWDALNRNWYRSGQPYRALARIDGTPNPVFARWLQHPEYDAYWQAMIPQGDEFAGIDIPILATTGYFDGGQVGVLHYLSEHVRHRPDADHTLLIGPYEHLAMQRGVSRVVQGYAIDPVASVDLQALRLAWFDHVFKGAAKPALLQDRINYQVMGADVWRHAPSLQAMSTTILRLHLLPGSGNGEHRLAAMSRPKASVSQQVDFRDRSDADWTESPDVVNPTLDAHGGLVFVSEPLDRDTEMGGLLSGVLDFTANKHDMDVTVTLYEQQPDGGYLQLMHYMRRASYAHDRRQRQLLVPGRPARLAFTSERLLGRKLGAGSRLVLVLNVNKRPDLQLNLGTGAEVSDETLADAGEPLRVRWHGSSHVDVPIVQ